MGTKVLTKYLLVFGFDLSAMAIGAVHVLLYGSVFFWHTNYQFMASLIKLLLETQSPHRVLSAFAKSFTITDALDLEDLEPDLSEYMHTRIEAYGPVGTAVQLFDTRT